MSDEVKQVTIEVDVPQDISWTALSALEDEMIERVGEVLAEYGLEWSYDERCVIADYTEYRDE